MSKWFWVYCNLWRTIPVYVIIKFARFSKEIKEDVREYCELSLKESKKSELLKFSYCIIYEKSLRNILQNRLHKNPILYLITRVLFRPLESCYINISPENYGGGFLFQHGFSTVVAAKKIGKCCHINQQVTIGYNGDYAPVIGDNVIIAAGAIVIGDVKIGNNVIVGAGSVVTHDIPDNVIVAGVPAKIIKERR